MVTNTCWLLITTALANERNEFVQCRYGENGKQQQYMFCKMPLFSRMQQCRICVRRQTFEMRRLSFRKHTTVLREYNSSDWLLKKMELDMNWHFLHFLPRRASNILSNMLEMEGYVVKRSSNTDIFCVWFPIYYWAMKMKMWKWKEKIHRKILMLAIIVQCVHLSFL